MLGGSLSRRCLNYKTIIIKNISSTKNNMLNYSRGNEYVLIYA